MLHTFKIFTDKCHQHFHWFVSFMCCGPIWWIPIQWVCLKIFVCILCFRTEKKKKKTEWVSCTFSLCKLAVDPTSSFHGFFHFFLSIFCFSFFFASFSNIQMDLANLSIRCVQIGRSELDGNGFGLKLCVSQLRLLV